MIFGIRFKLFTTLLLATGSVVLCMYLVMLWSFDRGFLDYVNKQDQHKYQAFAQVLAEHYEEEGSWQALIDSGRLGESLLKESFGLPARFGPSFSNERGFGPPDFHNPPPRRAKRNRDNRDQIEGRREGARRGGERGGGERAYDQKRRNRAEFEGRRRGERPPPMGMDEIARPLLLDIDKAVLHGHVKELSDLTLYPIAVNDITVGYVGQLKRKQLSDQLDLLFVKQQSQAFMFVAVIMVFICVLAALPVAAHFVKPIKRLSVGTQSLISGHYKTKIAVTSKDELGQLSQNFNSLANTLKENEQARRRWIADISHELRTPLAILKGEIEAIQDGIRPSSPEAITSLHSEVEHLNHLINDLYELSMSDIGALNYQKQALNAVTVLEGTVDSFRSEFENSGIELKFSCTPRDRNSSVLLADGARLKQLFSNLLKNTLRYTDSPGSLVIEATASSNDLTLSFKDSAPGVNEKELDSLFERLYRVESSRNRATGGAGLGLSICQNIVVAHDGHITAKACEMGGIWVTVVLPFKPSIRDVKPNKGEAV
jgi:two-component system sensor histidine kinase BaeS